MLMLESIISKQIWIHGHLPVKGLAQDCNNSSALVTELLPSCTKPSICCLLCCEINLGIQTQPIVL